MMRPDTTYLVLFSVSLTFIVTHLYGWILKWFYRLKAYSENFHELFPAQRAVGVIYLLQLCELPWLCHIGDDTILDGKTLRPYTVVTPTGIDEANDQSCYRQSSSRKFLKDGQIFILRDDKVYTIQGAKVK